MAGKLRNCPVCGKLFTADAATRMCRDCFIKEQEKELQAKVAELNKLHRELELQQAEILEQNHMLQEKEKLQAKALEDADKNLERARVKIMAEFVRNLSRQASIMEEAEARLSQVDGIPNEILDSVRNANNEFQILISKYRVD